MSTPCSVPSAVRRLAEALPAGLRAELDLTPKPGLVDRWDSGAHEDLDHHRMVCSIGLVGRYFTDCVAALEADAGIERLRALGIGAERRMMAQVGGNAHRGTIFLGGLLLGAVHRAGSLDPRNVSEAAAECAQRLFASHLPRRTKGGRVRAKYRVGGIVGEALDGLPAVFTIAVPALREGALRAFAAHDRLYLAMSRLMQTVEDTTALRRCGADGLARLRRDGRRLEALLLAGDDPIGFLTACNTAYRNTRLTMGGVADLLGVSVAWILAIGNAQRRVDVCGPHTLGEGV